MVEHYSTVKISEDDIHMGSEKTTYLHPEKFEKNSPFDVRETNWNTTNRDSGETCWKLPLDQHVTQARKALCSGARKLTAGNSSMGAMRKSTGNWKKSPFFLQCPF